MRNLILLAICAVLFAALAGCGDSGPGGDTNAASKDVESSSSKGGPELDPNDPRMPKGGGAPGGKGAPASGQK